MTVTVKRYLVIHHSGTSDSDSLSWPVIWNNHVQQGFLEIGYHFGVEAARGRASMLVGRSLLARAAGEPREGANRHGVHVCFIGNYDLVEPDPALLRFAAPRLADVCEVLGIDTALDESIRTHASFRVNVDGKTCPGVKFPMGLLRTLIRGA